MTMNWLPIPSDFRGDLRAALETLDLPHRLEKLAALAQHRLGFLETIQLDRTLGRLAVGPASGFSQVRLAILASSTVDHLAPAIRVAGLRRRLLIDVYVGAYGQYRQELADSTSPLCRFAPQVALLSLTPREAIASVPVTASATEADATISRTIEDLRGVWRNAREALKATLIQQTFLDVSEPLFGSHDRLVPGFRLQYIEGGKCAGRHSFQPCWAAAAAEAGIIHSPDFDGAFAESIGFECDPSLRAIGVAIET